MKYFFSSCALALGLVAPLAHAQTPAWTGAAQAINPTPADDTRSDGSAVATDAAGNTYVTGDLDAGGGSGAPGTRMYGSTRLTSTGLGSGFIGKLSPALQWQWAVRVATSGLESAGARAVTATPAGEVYAVVNNNDEFSASTLSVGSLNQAVVPGNMFGIVRLSTTGTPQWLALSSLPVFTNTSRTNAYVSSIGWDAASNVLVVVGGYTGSALVLGSITLPAAGGPACFVARLSPSGQWLSATSLAAAGTASGRALYAVAGAVGPQGQTAVGLYLSNGSLTLAGTTIVSSGTGSTNQRRLVAQLSPAGQWQWVAQPGGGAVASNLGFYALSYGRNGNLWALGSGDTGVQLGSTTFPANTEAYVAQLSATGQWGPVGFVVVAAGSSIDETRSLATDGQGNAVLAGLLDAGNSFAFGPTTLSAPTGRRWYTARFSAGGQWQYAQLAPASNTGSNSNFSFRAIALDAAGNLLATGLLRNGGTVAFGPTALTGSLYGDAFVARLANAGLLTARQPAGAPRLALFPNPAAAGTAVALRLPAPAAAARPLVLRDALGRTVYAGTLPAGQQQAALPTQGLAPGLYLLEAGPSRAQLVVE